jgi:hypothetical protein
MINKISLKFVFGFFGILLLAMIALVVTSYFDQSGVGETSPEMNLAENKA